MLALDPTDTIAAIASPPGPSARGIVRVGGPDSWRIVEAILEANGPCQRPATPSRVEGRLRVDGLRNRVPGSVAFWPGPRSFTGGPVAEFHLVGSAPILESLLATCLRLGAGGPSPGSSPSGRSFRDEST